MTESFLFPVLTELVQAATWRGKRTARKIILQHYWSLIAFDGYGAGQQKMWNIYKYYTSSSSEELFGFYGQFMNHWQSCVPWMTFIIAHLCTVTCFGRLTLKQQLRVFPLIFHSVCVGWWLLLPRWQTSVWLVYCGCGKPRLSDMKTRYKKNPEKPKQTESGEDG